MYLQRQDGTGKGNNDTANLVKNNRDERYTGVLCPILASFFSFEINFRIKLQKSVSMQRVQLQEFCFLAQR